MQKPEVTGFFDEATYTISYVVADPETKNCAIIDSLLDYDQASGRTTTTSANKLIQFVRQNGLTCEWIIDTHVHADHLSAAPFIKRETGAKIGIGEHITQVQKIFRPVFADHTLQTDGSDFDHLFSDQEHFQLGKLMVEVLFVPGHTPADVAYRIGDNVFVGDTMFMPDYGTARADFPGGDARKLYRSIQRLLALPDDTQLFMCHDYKAPGRSDYAWQTSVAEARNNVHLVNAPSEDEFVDMRQRRDATLSAPKLLLPSIQVNMRAGRFPKAESNGVTYLLVPVKPKQQGDTLPR